MTAEQRNKPIEIILQINRIVSKQSKKKLTIFSVDYTIN